MKPEQTLDWLAQQHFDQCREDRPIQYWIRRMKSELPPQPEQEPVAMWDGHHQVEFGNLSAYKLEKSSWIPLYTTLTLPKQEPDYKEALRVLSLALEEAPTGLTPKQRSVWVQSKAVLLSGGGMA